MTMHSSIPDQPFISAIDCFTHKNDNPDKLFIILVYVVNCLNAKVKIVPERSINSDKRL